MYRLLVQEAPEQLAFGQNLSLEFPGLTECVVSVQLLAYHSNRMYLGEGIWERGAEEQKG